MNINNLLRILLVCGMILTFSGLIGGCATVSSGGKSLMPFEESGVVTNWTSYDQAEAAFKKIVPGMTVAQLSNFGFDPKGPNVTVLDALTVKNSYFLAPNSGSRMEQYPPEIQACLNDFAGCSGLEFQGSSLQTHGQGSIFLRIFEFNKKDLISGWQFKALVLLQKNKVVWTTWKGEPNVKRVARQKKPLGPFDSILKNAPAMAIGAAF